jgi:ABC-type multidrug transport system permease subunit
LAKLLPPANCPTPINPAVTGLSKLWFATRIDAAWVVDTVPSKAVASAMELKQEWERVFIFMGTVGFCGFIVFCFICYLGI